MILELVALLVLSASESSGDTPARPLRRIIPDYPAACRPQSGEKADRQSVIVVYSITREGDVEGARVRESTDACFNETAIAAVRSWTFTPARAGGRNVAQDDVETTFTFILDDETQTADFDASPLKRYPPLYPERCMKGARSRESVLVEFDVTPAGETTNARVVESTNSCLNGAAISAVKRWEYRPKMAGGVAVERRGVRTMMTFELVGRTSEPPNRVAVGRKLNAVAASIRRGEDPAAVLEELAKIEAKYGDDFSYAELKAFHQLRGSARLSAKDYRGALDDFRVVRKLGISGESGEAIAKTIEQLEAIVAAEESAPSQPKPTQED